MNYLIRIVMNINKTSKIAYWLSSKREGGVRSSLGAVMVLINAWALIRKFVYLIKG